MESEKNHLLSYAPASTKTPEVQMSVRKRRVLLALKCVVGLICAFLAGLIMWFMQYAP